MTQILETTRREIIQRGFDRPDLLPSLGRIPDKDPSVVHERPDHLIERVPLRLRNAGVPAFGRSTQKIVWSRKLEFELVKDFSL